MNILITAVRALWAPMPSNIFKKYPDVRIVNLDKLTYAEFGEFERG